MPTVEVDAIESGDYHLNIHVVTARKPPMSRPGDLLLDGKRQDMTEMSYDAMARFKAMKTSPWKRQVSFLLTCLKITDCGFFRYEIDDNLTGIIENLKTLPGAPETLTQESEANISKMLKATQEVSECHALSS